MTTTTDPNRLHWEAVARGEPTDWAGLATEPDGIDQERVDEPAGLWLRPPDAPAGPVVLAVHGGGFVSASAATHRRMFGHLAAASGVPAFVVEYGLTTWPHSPRRTSSSPPPPKRADSSTPMCEPSRPPRSTC